MLPLDENADLSYEIEAMIASLNDSLASWTLESLETAGYRAIDVQKWPTMPKNGLHMRSRTVFSLTKVLPSWKFELETHSERLLDDSDASLPVITLSAAYQASFLPTKPSFSCLRADESKISLLCKLKTIDGGCRGAKNNAAIALVDMIRLHPAISMCLSVENAPLDYSPTPHLLKMALQDMVWSVGERLSCA